MHFFGRAAIATLSFAATSHALQAIILADTNRDGKFDIAGDSDIQGKLTWTEERGALFLANIADTDRRCLMKITSDISDDDIDKCHDASDNVLRHPKSLAPLRTRPDPNLADSAQGSITASGKIADKVRIFYKNSDRWVYIDAGYTFPAAELRAGLELGIDARAVRRPNEWDGRIRIDFKLADNGQSTSDYVELRVAPVLTHHTLQNPTEVFTAVVPTARAPGMKEFVTFIHNFTATNGIEKLVVEIASDKDIWVQDVFETAYTSIPGPDGLVVLGIMIRSSDLADEGRRLNGRKVFSELRSKSVGAVQHLPPLSGDRRPRNTEGLGNLETIPPYSHNGKTYLAGRVVMGKYNVKQYMFDFIEAQETQYPIEVDND